MISRHVLMLLRMLLQSRKRRIRERPQHSRHVLQRRPFFATLGQRACGLTFKINNDEVSPRKKDLAQMIVAMYASECDRQLPFMEFLKTLAGSVFEVQHLVGFCLEMRRHANLKPAKQPKVCG